MALIEAPDNHLTGAPLGHPFPFAVLCIELLLDLLPPTGAYSEQSPSNVC